MNQSNVIENFRKECRDYLLWRSRFEQLQESLKFIEYQSYHVHGIRYDVVRKKTIHEASYYWIEKKDAIEDEINECKNKMKKFESKFEDGDLDSWIVWNVYVENSTVNQIAERLGLNPNTVSHKISKQIRKMKME